jgi:hypothetical protein
MSSSKYQRAIMFGVFLVGLGFPDGASADRVIRYTPRPYSQQRAEQHIIHIEAMGGAFALDGADGKRDLALATGTRVRFSQGYSELWAVEAVALAGHGRRACLPGIRSARACGQPAREMDFARVAFGGVFRFGDKRIPHVRGNIGVQWTGHSMDEDPHDGEHELSLVPTLGAGYDHRFGQNVIVGATLSLSWVAASNLRARGFHSIDAGVRLGVGW